MTPTKQYVIADMQDGKHHFICDYDEITRVGCWWTFSLKHAARFEEAEKESVLAIIRKICDSKSTRLIPVPGERKP